MHTVLRIVLISLVSIIGLISCNRKSNNSAATNPPEASPATTTPPIALATPEPVTTPSPEPATPPEVRASPIPTPPKLQIRSAQKSGDKMASNSRLSLTSNDDFSKISLHITSTCSSRNPDSAFQTEVTALKLHGISQIPILNLVPEHYWLNADLTSLVSVYCDFVIEGTNELGLTDSLSLGSISIAHGEDTESILADQPSADNAGTLKIDEKDVTRQRNLHLICDHFRNRITIDGNSPAQNHVAQLVTGEPVSKYKYQDGREAYHLQTCRLISVALDSDSGLSTVNMSPLFQLSYPLKSQVSSGFGQPFATMNPQQPILEFQNSVFATFSVYNASSAPALYHFTKPSSFLTLQLFGRMGESLMRHPFVDLNLDWAIGGAKDVRGDLFSLASGQTATFVGRVRNEFRCMYWNFGSSPVSPATETILGFQYNLTQTPTVEQALNFSPDGNIDAVARATVMQAAKSLLSSTPTTGWIQAPLANQLPPRLQGPTGGPIVDLPPHNPHQISEDCFVGPPVSLTL